MPTIHHGDCIQVMNAMPPESVDAFTAAAHAEAENRHGCGMSPSEISDREEFKAGAEWALYHLADQAGREAR